MGLRMRKPRSGNTTIFLCLAALLVLSAVSLAALFWSVPQSLDKYHFPFVNQKNDNRDTDVQQSRDRMGDQPIGVPEISMEPGCSANESQVVHASHLGKKLVDAPLMTGALARQNAIDKLREGENRFRGFIFVSLTNWRDGAGCSSTLKELFSRCDACDKVVVGLVDQINPDNAMEKCKVPNEFTKQVRVARIDHRLGRGPAFARYLAVSNHFRGEEFYLQLDSRMGLVNGWDTKLKAMAMSIGKERFVISHVPPEGRASTLKDEVPFVCDGAFEDDLRGLFRPISASVKNPNKNGAPFVTPLAFPGFLFAPSRVLSEIPLSPHLPLLFYGEDLLISARLFTSGWDLFAPSEIIALYVDSRRNYERLEDFHGSSPSSVDSTRRVLFQLGLQTELGSPDNDEDLEGYGQGSVRPISKFWEFTGLNFSSHTMISRCSQIYSDHRQVWDERYLESYESDSIPFYTELVPDFIERSKKMLAEPQNKGRIFVSLSSYRDDVCNATLTELFQKCKHCDRVFVGLVEQRKEGEDIPCIGLSSYREKNVRRIILDPSKAKGPTEARYLASRLFKGEEYFFQVDSHLHFVQDWDVVLIDQIKGLPTEKGLVSVYPPVDSFDLTNTKHSVPWICNGTMNKGGAVLVQTADSWYDSNNARLKEMNAVPGSTPFIGAGFIFGPSTFLLDVPYDRYLDFLFHGEEVLMAARLWTYGWDFFIPTLNVVTHVYGHRKASVYRDNSEAYKHMAASKKRVEYLLKIKNERPDRDDEIEHLGMGTVRSIEEYYEFSGFDLINQKRTNNRCFQVYDYKNKQWKPKP